MGMYVRLNTLSDKNIERVVLDPELVEEVLFRGYKEKKGEVLTLQLTEVEGVDLYLDKSWHAIHYLLTKAGANDDVPHSFLLAGGRYIENFDVGINPPRAFSSSETTEIYEALRSIDDLDLLALFDGPDMMKKEIYPDIWNRKNERDQILAYIAEYLRQLRGFLRTTAGNELGFVVNLS